jgi:dTDP-glucose 4,6-dehydratase
MHNVLITGGAGFIGSNFIHFLLKEKNEIKIINLDALTYAGNLDNLKTLSDESRHHFVRGNICDRRLVGNIFDQFNIDTVVHFAAESHVDRSIENPLQFIQTNIVGTAILLDEAIKHWIKKKSYHYSSCRFHHISTDEVYGSLEPGQSSFTEKTPFAPNSPYAASKAASDHLVHAYAQTYQLPVTISNSSNNYGPYQFPEKLIPLVIQNAINGLPIPVYGDGKQIRDWLFVADHCSAILKIIEMGKPGESYNIGGNNQPFNIDIVNSICDILDGLLPLSPYCPHSKLIQFVKDRPGHDRRYAMDITKINNDLHWQPRENLTSGLNKTVQWYLDHSDWVKAITARPEYQKWMKLNYINRGAIKK